MNGLGDHPTVIIVDDHTAMMECVGSCLEQREGIQILGYASHAQAGLVMALEKRPEVVLMDIHMPGADAFWACKEIVQRTKRSTRVLFFTGFPLDQYIDRCLAAGGSGVISKHSETLSGIASAVRHVARGYEYYSPELAKRLVAVQSGEKKSRLATLAFREIEVLRQLSLGKTNREISELLNISLRSVEKEVSDLKNKLGLATTNELLMYSAREGLVHPELLGYPTSDADAGE